MNTKELLDRIFATQVLLFNRLNRIESSLSRYDAEYFGKCEGNDYRENLADIGMSIVGITAALSPPRMQPLRRAGRPVVSMQPPISTIPPRRAEEVLPYKELLAMMLPPQNE